MDQETKSRALRLITCAANVLYRLLILGALLWIGYGLQSIAVALNIPVEDSCTGDLSEDGPGQSDDQVPKIIRPLYRGNT